MLEPIHMLTLLMASARKFNSPSSFRQVVTLSQEVWDRHKEKKEIFLAEWIYYHCLDIGVWALNMSWCKRTTFNIWHMGHKNYGDILILFFLTGKNGIGNF